MTSGLSITRVDVVGVTKVYGTTVRALRGVTATFTPGLTVLEGANGSGKSTLLQIVGGAVKPTSGHVTFTPALNPIEARASIGWVSHEARCPVELSAEANARFAAEARGVDAGAAWTRAKGRFALGDFAERPLRTLSRGQRQRVALALALLHEPALLLLDEPTAGLDAKSVENLVASVGEEVERGAIVIVVTHDRMAFERLQPRRIELEAGRLRSE